MQAALIRVYTHWGRSAGWESPQAYARKIVVNLYATWRRRRWHSEVVHPEEESAADGHDMAGSAEARLELGRALAALPRASEPWWCSATTRTCRWNRRPSCSAVRPGRSRAVPTGPWSGCVLRVRWPAMREGARGERRGRGAEAGPEGLAEVGGQAGGLTAVEAFLAKAHRARARRRAAVAGCAVVLVAGGAGLGVRLSIGDRAPEESVSRATESPSPPKGGPLATGPASPRSGSGTGTTCPRSVICRQAVFGGRIWESRQGAAVRPQLGARADRHSGYMTLIDTDTALFETDEPRPCWSSTPCPEACPASARNRSGRCPTSSAYPMGPKNRA